MRRHLLSVVFAACAVSARARGRILAVASRTGRHARCPADAPMACGVFAANFLVAGGGNGNTF
jgi:hypothetical protein